MAAGLLFVQEAGFAKAGGGRRVDGLAEAAGPERDADLAGEGVFFEQGVVIDLLLLGGARLHVLLGDLHIAGAELAWLNGDAFNGVGPLAGAHEGADFQVVGTGLGVKVDAGKSVPEMRLLRAEEGEALATPRAGDAGGGSAELAGDEHGRTLLELVGLPEDVLDGIDVGAGCALGDCGCCER